MRIQPKKKACKPNSKSSGTHVEGCGKEVFKRTYGLCDSCYGEWLFETEEGKEKQKTKLPKCKECKEPFTPFYNNSLQKHCMKHDACITASLEDHKERRIKEAEQEKSRHRQENMSIDNYRKTYIQPLINHIARLVDHGQTCICTNLPDGKMNGGHRHSTGSNRTLTYNLHNIHNQSFQSNHHQSGDHLKYRVGLKTVYGVEYADYIDEKLMQCPSLNLEKSDLIIVKATLEMIKKRLIKLGLTYTPMQRLRLRDKINEEIGIYSDEYASFELYKQSI
ncbi:MAG: hypothetical protein ACJASM_003065 [Salibacteraceae bacterium]|jgi:hypothetical protein